MPGEIAWVLSSNPPRLQGQETTQEGVVRSNTDHGPGEVRLEFTAVSEMYVVTYRINEALHNGFWSWWKSPCLFGSKTFNWWHPRRKDWTDDLGYAGARFLKAPTSLNVEKSGESGVGGAAGSLYDVTCEIEVLP